MGHFRLDVDPAAVTAAGRRLCAAAPDFDAHAGTLGDVGASVAQGWEGAAAATATREMANLARHARRARPHFDTAGAALTQLAEAYREAEEVAVRDLNRRWDEAHAGRDAAVAEAGSRRAAALRDLPSSIPAFERIALLASANAAAGDAIAAADAALAATVRALEREYDELVETLRRRTRRASEALAAAVLVPVPPVTVALHGTMDLGWFDVRLAGPDVLAAFARSLPLGTLDRRLADPPDDVDGIRALLDEARAAGVPPTGYAQALRSYWVAMAMRDAGIDPARWDPSKGADHNREIIEAVYAYYGQLYLEHPELQWAGMANLVGSSFAAGFFDLAELRRLGEGIADLPAPVRAALPPGAEDLSRLTAADIRFYETTLLNMQRNIFLDQGSMHAAYVHDGLPALEEMYAAGLIDSAAVTAWRRIDRGRRTGDPAALRAGNVALLRREQFQIIQRDYERMRDHFPTGPAVTWGMTLIGAPSIPRARGYADVFPLTVNVETPGPGRFGTPRSILGRDVPSVSVDNPAQVSVEIETPFPAGNISNADQRWALIEQDTLRRYLDLAEGDPERLRRIIRTPFSARVEPFRLRNRVDDILRDLADWNVDVDQ